MEQLETLLRLFELGYITVQEYEQRKTQMIDSMTNTSFGPSTSSDQSKNRFGTEEKSQLAQNLSKLNQKQIDYLVNNVKTNTPAAITLSENTGQYCFNLDAFDDATFVEVKRFVHNCLERVSRDFVLGPSLPLPGVKRTREVVEGDEDEGDLPSFSLESAKAEPAGSVKRTLSQEDNLEAKRRRESIESKPEDNEFLNAPLLTVGPTNESPLRRSLTLEDGDFMLDNLLAFEPDIPPFLEENPNLLNLESFPLLEPPFFNFDQLAYEENVNTPPVLNVNNDPMMLDIATPQPTPISIPSTPQPTEDKPAESKKIKITIQIYRVEKNGDDAKPYHCDAPGCTKAFSDSSNLLKHIRTHTGEKPYVCNECGKTFSHSSSLKEHTNTHLGSKPFVCTYQGCTKSFAQASNLRRHIRTHTGVKPYACEVCGKEFNQSSNWKQHMKLHTEKTTSKGKQRRKAQSSPVKPEPKTETLDEAQLLQFQADSILRDLQDTENMFSL